MLEDMMITIFNDDIGINQDVIEVDDVVKLLEQIKIKIISMSCRYSLARERGCEGQVEWSDRLIKEGDVLKIFEEYQKGGKE